MKPEIETNKVKVGKMEAGANQNLKSDKLKVDNMIKARAEHAGILKEVEVLRAEGVPLTAVKKSRLANIETTAETAVELLNPVAR